MKIIDTTLLNKVSAEAKMAGGQVSDICLNGVYKRT